MRDRFDVAFANDPDADRHGIVTPSAGLLNPNHHLAACVAYLFGGGRDWGTTSGSARRWSARASSTASPQDLGRRLVEVPVGFKWFVDGLLDGTLGFGGEESAGASFLRRDGSAWSTDKDGLIPCLLAAEMKAKTGKDPGEIYAGLEERFGHAVVPARRRRGDARGEGRAQEALARAGRELRAGGRADPRQAHERARQRRRDRRPEGRRRARLVRRAAVRAPRTCTRCTPRASTARSASSGSSTRPATSSSRR